MCLPDPGRRQQDEPMSETLLDVKGMSCPLPVLRANRALRGLEAGVFSFVIRKREEKVP